jgi:hypothetical protein
MKISVPEGNKTALNLSSFHEGAIHTVHEVHEGLSTNGSRGRVRSSENVLQVMIIFKEVKRSGS